MAGRVVTAALVVARTQNGVIHLYKGDVVPSSVTSGSLANLEDLGFVTKGEVDPNPEPLERPAESGPGSAKDKWLAYAGNRGVQVDPESSKEDIIAAVSAAGH